MRITDDIDVHMFFNPWHISPGDCSPRFGMKNKDGTFTQRYIVILNRTLITPMYADFIAVDKNGVLEGVKTEYHWYDETLDSTNITQAELNAWVLPRMERFLEFMNVASYHETNRLSEAV